MNTMRDEFFRAYGSAMFAWQEVETALFKLYHSMNVLYGESDIMRSAELYYKKKTFGSKLELVKKLAPVVDVNRFVDWNSLESDLKAASGIRNSLAHRPAQLEELPDGTIRLVFGEPIFKPISLREMPVLAFQYDTNRCVEFCCDFKCLAQRVDEAHRQIPHQFANNKLIVEREK